jgi:hypothetical protein
MGEMCRSRWSIFLIKNKLISLENYVFFFYQKTGKNLCIHLVHVTIQSLSQCAVPNPLCVLLTTARSNDVQHLLLLFSFAN